MRRIHISNSGAHDALVAAAPPKISKSTWQGLDSLAVTFKRFIAVGPGHTHDELAVELGNDYADALIKGDPEIDLERVGEYLSGTQMMLTTSKGEPMYASPRLMEIVYDAKGVEIERKDPQDTAATVTDEIPLSWTGRKMPKGDVVRQFMFRRSLEIKHVDGVTFDFLYNMAKELHESESMMLMGAGATGKEAIVLQLNGSAYRGFLEGRIEGETFKLLLHLSNMELKAPSGKEES